jgi:hypothetical protein
LAFHMITEPIRADSLTNFIIISMLQHDTGIEPAAVDPPGTRPRLTPRLADGHPAG